MLVLRYLLAGLEEAKITCATLRHTAALLRLEAGDSEVETQRFLGKTDELRVRYYLERLPGAAIPAPIAKAAEPYKRRPLLPQTGEQRGLTHGMWASHLPETEMIEAAQATKGLEGEIARLRVVMERALDLALGSESPETTLRLLDVYSIAGTRLARLLKSQEELKRDDWESIVEIAIREVGEELGITGSQSAEEE